MPVIGLNFKTFEGKRDKGMVRGEIKVNSTPKIKNVREITVPNLKKKALSFTFEFTTQYSPDMGEIKISGELLYLAEKNQPILKQWKTKKSIPENVSVDILNHLFRRCLVRIATIADDLQLPPPIQIPRVRPQKEEAGYVG